MKSVTCPKCGFHDDGFSCCGITIYWDEEVGDYVCPDCGEVMDDERY